MFHISNKKKERKRKINSRKKKQMVLFSNARATRCKVALRLAGLSIDSAGRSLKWQSDVEIIGDSYWNLELHTW